MNEKYPWRFQIAASLPLLALVVVLWALFGSERAVSAFFAEWRSRHHLLAAGIEHVTDYGNYCLYCIYVFFLIGGCRTGNGRWTRLALSFIVAFTVTLLTVYLIKGTVGRARPYLDPEFQPWTWTDDYHSFLSGHTTEAVISVVPVSLFLRKWRVALILGAIAAFIAFTRVYLSMHYLTDVCGGLVMGNLGGLLTWLLFLKSERA